MIVASPTAQKEIKKQNVQNDEGWKIVEVAEPGTAYRGPLMEVAELVQPRKGGR